MRVSSRLCQAGEVYSLMNNVYECLLCEEGKYSFKEPSIEQPREIACQICPPQAKKCEANSIQLKNGYWRESESSEIIYTCDKLQMKCEAENPKSKFNCGEGSIGPKCQACDIYGKIWGASYARFADNACTDCNDHALQSLFLVVMGTLTLLYVIVLVWKNCKAIEQKIIAITIIKLGIVRMGRSAIFDSFTTLSKIFMNYIQFIFILTEMDINLPRQIHLIEVGGDPIFNILFSVDCFLANYQGIKMVYLRIIWVLLYTLSIAIIIICGFVLSYFLLILRVKQHHKQKMSLLRGKALKRLSNYDSNNKGFANLTDIHDHVFELNVNKLRVPIPLNVELAQVNQLPMQNVVNIAVKQEGCESDIKTIKNANDFQKQESSKSEQREDILQKNATNAEISIQKNIESLGNLKSSIDDRNKLSSVLPFEKNIIAQVYQKSFDSELKSPSKGDQNLPNGNKDANMTKDQDSKERRSEEPSEERSDIKLNPNEKEHQLNNSEKLPSNSKELEIEQHKDGMFSQGQPFNYMKRKDSKALSAITPDDETPQLESEDFQSIQLNGNTTSKMRLIDLKQEKGKRSGILNSSLTLSKFKTIKKEEDSKQVKPTLKRRYSEVNTISPDQNSSVYYFKINSKYFQWYTGYIWMSLKLLFFYLQPGLVKMLISALTCVKIGSKSYVLADFTFECDDEYRAWSLLGILPILLTVCFIIPLILLWELHSNRNNQTSYTYLKSYGFFFQEYRQNKYFWEILRMTVKMFISFVLVFYNEELSLKFILSILIISFYLLIQLRSQPYRQKAFNKLDFNSNSVIIVSLLLGLLISQTQILWLRVTAVSTIIIINIYFLSSITHQFFKTIILPYDPSLRSWLHRFLYFLYIHVPILSGLITVQKSCTCKIFILWRKLSLYVHLNKDLLLQQSSGHRVPQQKYTFNPIASVEGIDCGLERQRAYSDSHVDVQCLSESIPNHPDNSFSHLRSQIQQNKSSAPNIDTNEEKPHQQYPWHNSINETAQHSTHQGLLDTVHDRWQFSPIRRQTKMQPSYYAKNSTFIKRNDIFSQSQSPLIPNMEHVNSPKMNSSIQSHYPSSLSMLPENRIQKLRRDASTKESTNFSGVIEESLQEVPNQEPDIFNQMAEPPSRPPALSVSSPQEVQRQQNQHPNEHFYSRKTFLFDQMKHSRQKTLQFISASSAFPRDRSHSLKPQQDFESYQTSIPSNQQPHMSSQINTNEIYLESELKQTATKLNQKQKNVISLQNILSNQIISPTGQPSSDDLIIPKSPKNELGLRFRKVSPENDKPKESYTTILENQTSSESNSSCSQKYFEEEPQEEIPAKKFESPSPLQLQNTQSLNISPPHEKLGIKYPSSKHKKYLRQRSQSHTNTPSQNANLFNFSKVIKFMDEMPK